MIKCKKCGLEVFNESEVDLHHIVPKVIGGKDIDGRAYLCSPNKGNDCHRKLHIFLREEKEIKELLKISFDRWLKNDS